MKNHCKTTCVDRASVFPAQAYGESDIGQSLVVLGVTSLTKTHIKLHVLIEQTFSLHRRKARASLGSIGWSWVLCSSISGFRF